VCTPAGACTDVRARYGGHHRLAPLTCGRRRSSCAGSCRRTSGALIAPVGRDGRGRWQRDTAPSPSRTGW
jgi:hypothetical protein